MDDLGYDAPIWVKNKDISSYLWTVDISTHFSFWLYSIPSPLWGRMWTIHSSSGNEHDEQENSLW
jgi:hypothetical protein